jgi:lipopolysaccharide transport system permease protein
LSFPFRTWLKHYPLATELVRRELKARYLGTFSGGLWALFQPMLQLAIYGYVFTTIFKARLPEAEFGNLGFIAFLAVGLWPWTAFAEGLMRSSTTIIENAGLLGKVALPRPLLVGTTVFAGMALHLCGFAAVLIVMMMVGWIEPRITMVWVLPLFLLMFGFTLGMAWLFSAVSVFVRDFTHVLGQVVMLVFFLTPVLYPRSLIPAGLLPIADGNPLALFVGLFRQSVLGIGHYDVWDVLVALMVTVAVMSVGWTVFRRLSPHFEDFL